MKKCTAWLLLAMVFPFLTGFDTAATERKITLFPEGPLFFVPLASPKEPRTHVTWLRLKLPDDSFNIFAHQAGLHPVGTPVRQPLMA
jgi:hypothetical protein